MSTAPIYLAISRSTPSQRAHFGLFIPHKINPDIDPDTTDEVTQGTIIHVVGAPMAGFTHQFKRNSIPSDLRKLVLLGQIDEALIWMPPYSHAVEESTARGELDRLALRIDPPRVSANFLAPVDDVKNRRCQEWTMELLRLLAAKGVLEAEAVEIAQKERDPPNFGIGLRAVGEGGKRDAAKS